MTWMIVLLHPLVVWIRKQPSEVKVLVTRRQVARSR
jgi:hypothetical protein